jgi:hypothetical protein
MLAGTWFTRNRKVMPLSIAAVTILYISMYSYYVSISLEIMGAIILSLAYVSAYTRWFSKIVKLV